MAGHQIRGRMVHSMAKGLKNSGTSSRRSSFSGSEVESIDDEEQISNELFILETSALKSIEEKYNLHDSLSNQSLFEDLNLVERAIIDITEKQKMSPEKYKKENEKKYSGFFNNLFEKYSLEEYFNILQNYSYPNQTNSIQNYSKKLKDIEEKINKLNDSQKITNLKKKLDKIKNQFLNLEQNSKLMKILKNNKTKYDELHKKHLELLGKNTDNKYKEKYLKYKLKYLELKKLIQQ